MTARTTCGPAIRVRDLEKSCGKLRVLRGVDFDVARGSIFALLERRGQDHDREILSTLLKPDAGTATVNGFDAATEAANVRESISLTGQFAAVDETLTGRENLVLVARLRHLTAPARSRAACWPASSSPTPRSGGCRGIPQACAAAWTSP